MDPADLALVERIVDAFRVKRLIPQRGKMNVIVKDGSYVLEYGGMCTCAIGAILWGEHASADLWTDAARVLGVDLQLVPGIVYGFDGVAATGIDGTRGPAIGAEVARRLFE